MPRAFVDRLNQLHSPWAMAMLIAMALSGCGGDPESAMVDPPGSEDDVGASTGGAGQTGAVDAGQAPSDAGTVDEVQADGEAAPECASDKDCEAVETAPCKLLSCDVGAGICVAADAADGSACSTDSQCVTQESCQQGQCVGVAVDCDDQNTCTDDSCHPSAGCQHATIADCCVAACGEKSCGDDGCGGSCGTCETGGVCSPEGVCCAPACTDKDCGDDGCGGVCGTCQDTETCTAAGQCACVPSCADKTCGDDGCGGACGTCQNGQTCTVKGKCVAPTCVPDCAGKACGDDGCGGSCGACASDAACTAAICKGGSCEAVFAPGDCDDGDACTTEDTCTETGCAGAPITDGYEPNESWLGAHLPNLTDCDKGPFNILATLNPTGDVDWYWYQLEDTLGCIIDPVVTVIPPSGKDYDVCAYYDCLNGNEASVSCKVGLLVPGPTSTSWGCCSSAEFATEPDTVRLSVSCGIFGDTSGFVDIMVSSPTDATCDDYTLEWGDL